MPAYNHNMDVVESNQLQIYQRKRGAACRVYNVDCAMMR